MLHDVRAFAGNHPQSDDITLMVIRYDGVPDEKATDNYHGEEGRDGPKLRIVGNT